MSEASSPLLPRPATMDDDAAIAELTTQLGYPCSTSDARHRLKVILGSHDDAVFVTVDEDRVLGWIHVKRTMLLENGERAEIWGLVVDQQHRGKGLGRSLVACAEDWAAKRAIPVMRVRTRSTRADAHRFYEREGYSLNKEQKVYEKALGE